ncbi:MAG: alkylphosphonate utilization protein [Pseudotabrizicola sp.]|uniref:alkylphosphonate utilization protein n=1 Tax=Pseudotabrizicola sp. TaxID=2939647 RepID=UPI002725B3AF|nr:alkylphosphonate utilization protein [Pseudotabrizicola sp.]MDO8884672.1 alkylphosphonate utilization protein [Pseudotabrizicola sp.]MDP2080148.1 alkylphosphonate utilization protein [Pseudotabrizicola sp.]MDZ7574978.1 alkylphosphonate utilization protein [Pseudotabrizicola sp.]
MTTCVLCAAPDASPVQLAPGTDIAALCRVCAAALSGEITPGPRWRCLGDAVWSEHAGKQIAAYRLLKALTVEPWASELLETVYLDPEVLARAEAGQGEALAGVVHRDSNGVQLAAGDTVMLIKDLPVKGSSMVAKRGTAVRGIRLVYDNADHIEGRVNGQTIVILCQFVKKSV